MSKTTKTTFTGQLICSILDSRYLSNNRVWTDMSVDYAVDSLSLPFNRIIKVLDNSDCLDFSEIIQLMITYTDGKLTAWEVLV